MLPCGPLCCPAANLREDPSFLLYKRLAKGVNKDWQKKLSRGKDGRREYAKKKGKDRKGRGFEERRQRRFIFLGSLLWDCFFRDRERTMQRVSLLNKK